MVVLSVALMSINYLVWIIVGQYVLGFRLGLVPGLGLRVVAVPAAAGAGRRDQRAGRERAVLPHDHAGRDVQGLRAHGVRQGRQPRRGVLFKHVLKNAMIPIVTNVIIAIPFLYTGSLLLESFFGIPGLGYLGVNAINSSDVDVVRAEVFIGSVLFVIANLRDRHLLRVAGSEGEAGMSRVRVQGRGRAELRQLRRTRPDGGRSLWADAWAQLRRSRLAMVCLWIVVRLHRRWRSTARRCTAWYRFMDRTPPYQQQNLRGAVPCRRACCEAPAGHGRARAATCSSG